MVTPAELARVEVFSALDEAGREHLSRVVADIALAPGEYAAHEGDAAALYALIEGRIEAVKVIDGVDRVVGRRLPGDIFGEVSIVIGTTYPVGFRAAEASRVLRLEARDYHEIAAVFPEVAAEVGKLAADRMSGPRGLQGIAAEPRPPRAVVFGKRADAQCAQLRHFLDRNQISLSLGQPRVARRLEQWGPGPLPDEGDCPVIRLDGGKTVIKPRCAALRNSWGSAPRPAPPSTTPSSSAAARAAWPLPCTAPPKDSARSSSSARRPAARPAPPRASRTTSASPPASPATSSRAGRSSRRAGSAPRSS